MHSEHKLMRRVASYNEHLIIRAVETKTSDLKRSVLCFSDVWSHVPCECPQQPELIPHLPKHRHSTRCPPAVKSSASRRTFSSLGRRPPSRRRRRRRSSGSSSSCRTRTSCWSRGSSMPSLTGSWTAHDARSGEGRKLYSISYRDHDHKDTTNNHDAEPFNVTKRPSIHPSVLKCTNFAVATHCPQNLFSVELSLNSSF